MALVCGTCREESLQRETLPEYLDETLGISVTLRNSVVREACTNCGEETIIIPGDDKLTFAVAMARLMTPVCLRGSDVKFLRKACGLKSKELSELLDVRPETMSRWENKDERLGGFSEKLLRHTIGALINEKAPAIHFDPKLIVEMNFVDIELLCPFGEFELIELEKDDHQSDEWELLAA